LIYFAQTPTGSVKIGCTDNIEARLQALESHYGQPLALLATMPGDCAIEAEIHERFAHLRFGNTEQFRPAADLLEFIGKPLLVNPDPDAVEVVKPRSVKGIRLDLSPADHKRVARAARERGLTMSSYARQALLERLKADEGGLK